METTNPVRKMYEYDFSEQRIKNFFDKINKNGPIWVPSFEEIWEKPSKCWVWEGAKDKNGYGNFTVAKGKTSKSHRFSFLLRWGWLLPPPYYQVDHKCLNTSCVNPYHLMCISYIYNNEKSTSPSAINKRKTHCKMGHEFSEVNTIRKNGRRICIKCDKEKGRL